MTTIYPNTRTLACLAAARHDRAGRGGASSRPVEPIEPVQPVQPLRERRESERFVSECYWTEEAKRLYRLAEARKTMRGFNLDETA